MKPAYYNEHDDYAAQLLRNLIAAGHIAPGDVDTRSIEDVAPDDLTGYGQCHFFAGVGVWSYALRRAGVPDGYPVWTGSCPCQPFSAAGKGVGFDDERHLWPHFHWLISQCRPAVVLGEQVASKDGLAWLDLVQADLEGAGYTSGAVDTCAAGFGAPHIRQRLYWVAYADDPRTQGRRGMSERADQCAFWQGGMVGRLADTSDQRQHGRGASQTSDGRDAARIEPERLCDAGRLEHASSQRRERREAPASGHIDDVQASVGAQGEHGSGVTGAHWLHQHSPGPTNGHWRNADWLLCRDGKWRPVEPGTFPLADGSAGRVGRVRADQERIAALVPRKDQGSRVGRLRAYGNAIVGPQAEAFIRAVMEIA